jgi:hypothetical protein
VARHWARESKAQEKPPLELPIKHHARAGDVTCGSGSVATAATVGAAAFSSQYPSELPFDIMHWDRESKEQEIAPLVLPRRHHEWMADATCGSGSEGSGFAFRGAATFSVQYPSELPFVIMHWDRESKAHKPDMPASRTKHHGWMGSAAVTCGVDASAATSAHPANIKDRIAVSSPRSFRFASETRTDKYRPHGRRFPNWREINLFSGETEPDTPARVISLPAFAERPTGR